MKIKLTEKIMELDDSKAIIMDNSTEDLILRKVCVVALTANDPKVVIPPDEKFEQALLAQKITENDVLDIDVDNLALLKRLIGHFWNPTVVFRAWNMINPPPEKDGDKKNSKKKK